MTREQLGLLDQFLRIRTVAMVGVAAAAQWAPDLGDSRHIVSLAVALLMIPFNEFIRHRVKRTWRGLPAIVPWIDLLAGVGAIVIEPTFWASALLLVSANLSLPFALHSRRNVLALVCVGAAAFIATAPQASDARPINLAIAAALALPMLYFVIAGIGGRDRTETSRRVHLLNGLDAVAWEFDVDRRSFTFVSERAERRLGTPSARWLEDPSAWLARVHPDDRRQLWSTALDKSTPGVHELRVVENDEVSWWRLTLSRSTHTTRQRLIHGVMVEISDLRRAQEALRAQAESDPLTGLPNRALLMTKLDAHFSGSPEHFGLLLIDLDAFKNINDSIGHAAGDSLLVEVARRLEAVAGPGGFVARLGGDEFAVIVSGDDIRERANDVARRVAAAMLEPIIVLGAELRIAASIGIAVWPGDAADPISLLRRADLTMYVAKRGRLGSASFEPRHDDSNRRTATLMSDLPGAILTGQLTAHLQPRVCLESGSIVGAEALARWIHPVLGSIRPDEFIPVAEMTGSSSRLTSFMLLEANRIVAPWHAAGHDLDIAVNITASDLLSPELLTTVESLRDNHGATLNRLVLEITETQVMDNIDLVQPALDRLRELGVRLSLDDFGTGHSSFARLRDLKMAEIKIDRSFVHGLETGSSNEPIVRSIIELGRNLGLLTVAEGIEDQRTLDRIRALGCEQAQGYYLGRPVPADEFARLHLTPLQERLTADLIS